MIKRVTVFLMAVICLWSLSACRSKTMNEIIASEPSITGLVTEIREESILLETTDGILQVSQMVQNSDSMTHFSIGDEVVVYYDGTVSEDEPRKINTVYAITLKTPARRSENNRS